VYLTYYYYLPIIITSPEEAMAKYCNEYVCVTVRVCPRGYLRNHTRDLCQFLCMLPVAVAPSSSGWVTKSRGKRQFWGFLPHWQCIVHNSIWDPCKNGWLKCRLGWWLGWALDTTC